MAGSPAVTTLATIASKPTIEVAGVLLVVQGVSPVLSILVGKLASETGCEVAEILGKVAVGVAIGGPAAKVLEEGLEVVCQITICEL
jgi:hypothetical protein